MMWWLAVYAVVLIALVADVVLAILRKVRP